MNVLCFHVPYDGPIDPSLFPLQQALEASSEGVSALSSFRGRRIVSHRLALPQGVTGRFFSPLQPQGDVFTEVTEWATQEQADEIQSVQRCMDALSSAAMLFPGRVTSSHDAT